MRTTITFDEDVAAAVDQIRSQRGLGLSEAVNQLVRQALVARQPQRPVRLRTARLGLRVDVSNVSEALELAESPPPGS